MDIYRTAFHRLTSNTMFEFTRMRLPFKTLTFFIFYYKSRESSDDAVTSYMLDRRQVSRSAWPIPWAPGLVMWTRLMDGGRMKATVVLCDQTSAQSEMKLQARGMSGLHNKRPVTTSGTDINLKKNCPTLTLIKTSNALLWQNGHFERHFENINFTYDPLKRQAC